MEKRLNTELINVQLEKKGLNQSSIAKLLQVSRESVSKWLKNEYFPDPKNLIRLSSVLDMQFNELVIKNSSNQPLIEFRKNGNSKITEAHLHKAINMGLRIQDLLPYFAEKYLTESPILSDPRYEYNYINNVTDYLRKSIKKDNSALNLENLVELLKKLNASLIPVLWGSNKNHRNALHIYLPESKTTWIFVNLDSWACDINFWIAHELGHVISKKISEDVKEKFAEDFSETLLFPISKTEALYENILNHPTSMQIEKIKLIAEEYNISPVTVYMQMKKYALHKNKPEINLENNIYKAFTVFKNRRGLYSKQISGGVDEFIEISESKFFTPIYNALKKYDRNKKLSVGFIQQLFDISTSDSIALFEAIKNEAD